MRYLKVALPVFLALGITASIKADDKPMLPAGSMTLDDTKKQAGSQKTPKPAPVKQMSQSRSGFGNFFHKLFGPSEPKLNGTIISGAQTYKNGIMPVAPVYNKPR